MASWFEVSTGAEWGRGAIAVDLDLHKVLELPSDIELDAMDPVAALAHLQDIEEQLLRGIQGERQSVHDRIR